MNQLYKYEDWNYDHLEDEEEQIENEIQEDLETPLGELIDEGATDGFEDFGYEAD